MPDKPKTPLTPKMQHALDLLKALPPESRRKVIAQHKAMVAKMPAKKG